MRGVACSWKEMQRIRKDILPLITEHGEAKLAAEFRCVTPQAITEWRRSAEVMDILDEENSRYLDFTNCQPSHVCEIARHFRKKSKPEKWNANTKREIARWVQRCEAEQLTVKALQKMLNPAIQTNGVLPKAASESLVDRLAAAIAARKTGAKKDKVLAHYGVDDRTYAVLRPSVESSLAVLHDAINEGLAISSIARAEREYRQGNSEAGDEWIRKARSKRAKHLGVYDDTADAIEQRFSTLRNVCLELCRFEKTYRRLSPRRRKSIFMIAKEVAAKWQIIYTNMEKLQ